MQIYEVSFHAGQIAGTLIGLCVEDSRPNETDNYYQHRHPHYELHWVSKGSCRIAFEKKTQALKEKEMILIPPGCFHRIFSLSHDFSHMTVSLDLFSPERAAELPPGAAFHKKLPTEEPMLLPVTEEAERELQTMKAICTAKQSEPMKKERLCAHCLLLLTTLTKESVKEDYGAGAFERFGKQKDLIDVFFARRFSSDSSMEDLARELSISTRQLHRILKKEYGMNYREMMSESRIKIATDLLVNTNRSVADIADLLGYSSAANFSAFMKRSSGKTPSDIRRMGRK
ncbi:MAG: AraC family transcriptional regulator [Clostridia bacterium]|nr:AraC family transcriptional regulator [Clostridia bacterium]